MSQAKKLVPYRDTLTHQITVPLPPILDSDAASKWYVDQNGGGAVTLASAGGTETLVVDGVGPAITTKGLTAGTGIGLVGGANDVTISNTDGASSVTLASAGGTETLVVDGTGPSLTSKGLTAGTGITLTPSGTDVTISTSVSEPTLNSTVITTDRDFPEIGTEGVATLGALNATRMWVSVWGAGGGGSRGNSEIGGAGGGSGSAVVKVEIYPNSSALSGETLATVLGAGGAGATVNSTDGGDGGNSTLISSDTGTTVNLIAYGGGGGDQFNNGEGGGAAGTGGAASTFTGGAANTSGGGAGADGSRFGGPYNLDVQSVIGVWFAGVTGGANADNGEFGAERGSHFFNAGRGGAASGASGGGAGGFNGDGGDGGTPGVDAPANSGAGGGGGLGGGTEDGGDGGSGGALIEWWS